MDPLPFCNSLFILKEWKPNAKKRIIMQISRNLIFREDSSFFKMFHLKQIRFCSGAKKVKTKLRKRCIQILPPKMPKAISKKLCWRYRLQQIEFFALHY